MWWRERVKDYNLIVKNEDGILDLRKYNEGEDDDDNYSPFDNFDPNWKPTPYGSDDDY